MIPYVNTSRIICGMLFLLSILSYMGIFLTFTREPTEQSYLNLDTFIQIMIYISLTIFIEFITIQ